MFNILIRLDPATTDSCWFPQTHTHEHLHQFIARDPDTTPREHGGYFCSCCFCCWSWQQQQKQLQWKTKKKKPQLPAYSKLYSKFIPRWTTTPAQSSRPIVVSPRTPVSHAKFPCQAEEETQHKLHRNYTLLLVAAAPSWLKESLSQWSSQWQFSFTGGNFLFAKILEFRQNGDFNHSFTQIRQISKNLFFLSKSPDLLDFHDKFHFLFIYFQNYFFDDYPLW